MRVESEDIKLQALMKARKGLSPIKLVQVKKKVNGIQNKTIKLSIWIFFPSKYGKSGYIPIDCSALRHFHILLILIYSILRQWLYR